MIPKRGYEHEDAEGYMRAIKNGDYESVEAYLEKNRFLVYQFDMVDKLVNCY